MLKINSFQEKIKFLNTEKMKKLLLIIIFLLLSFNSFSQFKKIKNFQKQLIDNEITGSNIAMVYKNSEVI